MSDSKQERPSPRITDEGVARLRERIGIPEPHPVPPRYLRPNEDAFRHVANACGDDNPLYCHPEYASKTRWEGPIAPPQLAGGDSLVGEDEVPEVAAEHRELMRGDPLRGVHAFYSASAREWWAPMRPGRRIFRRNALVGVLDKQSEFAKRAIHEWTGQVFRDEDGQLLGGQYRLMVRSERSEARKRAGERQQKAEIELGQYDKDGIEEIDAQYRSEAPRGAVPRYFEDVNEGDEVGPIVKGPMTVTDMVCWHAGVGMGLYGVAPLRLGFKNRQRIPRFYHLDEQGIPDAMQRCHWDPAYARKVGNPTTYDYGRMRETWLIHLCTDWMGDDAWLWKLDCEFRKFNFVGDTHWMRGRVERKFCTDADQPAVELSLEGRNQRDEVTTPGSATVLLPSREHGPVRLPEPPGGQGASLQTALESIAARFDRH